MATLVLSAAGAALGSSIGGSVLGLSMSAVGRFAGATLGRAIDQRILGAGAQTIETGRLDRLRLSTAGEGQPVPQAYGRMRVGGHIIWATQFKENVSKSGGGGKGASRQPTIKEYTYSVSLAVALCEGEITSVNRLWADGAEISIFDLNMRVYPGSRDQLPDPKMEAVEGIGLVPAYRGTAYVVFEDLDLARFGNRVPQFSFEVTRPVQEDPEDVPFNLRAVALIPGTGEYSLATEPVSLDAGAGRSQVVNVNSPSDRPDFVTSLKHLQDEVPDCGAVSLVVSWFGSDLRCGSCEIQPKVEQTEVDSTDMPWVVNGLVRSDAGLVPVEEGRPVYGGTPCDASVVQSIRDMQAKGLDVVYYPFILMEQMPDNGLPDPWSGNSDQPKLPWRGRITASVAPGQPGDVTGTSDIDDQVAAFFGSVSVEDFAIEEDEIVYSGPTEWSYRRFILHQAHLCALAGGVTAFCIGSEMRSLTQLRGAAGFPAVDALRTLAAECRAILGSDVQIGYAADWSEYFGYQPTDGSGDVYFHLDPLWADPNIDFIGIDNYMRLSDWRDGDDHADADWGSIYNLDYLEANVAGGEGYDWYYPSREDRDAQNRVAITDGAHNEPWVYRYKDILNWWSQPHHNRINGQRDAVATDWVPQSKPIWFTEIGCAAVDKGTNEPNKFIDPKSSESTLPVHSNGMRDELIQRQYLRALTRYWSNPAHNPVSTVYNAPMIDMGRVFVWAWDARPYPWFPNVDEMWSDGPNFRRGHWINGRVSGRTLASVVTEICERSGLSAFDVSALYGFVRGYLAPDVSDARRALQPLMMAYGFDAIERDGVLLFRNRTAAQVTTLIPEDLALHDDLGSEAVQSRSSEAEMSGRVRLNFVEADGDYRNIAEEAVLPDEQTHAVAESEVPLLLTRPEGRQSVERWLAEARVSRDAVRFALPLSKDTLGAGDVVKLPDPQGAVTARIDRVELTTHQLVEAVRIEPDVYRPSDFPDDPTPSSRFQATGPVLPLFLDLPLITGDEVPHAPYLALTADPWPGEVAVYDAAEDAGYGLNGLVPTASTIGVTVSDIRSAPSGVPDRGSVLDVKLTSGALSSIGDVAFLAGGNLAAIGGGSVDGWEVIQFRDATLIDPDTWRLSYLLRGQLGTDAIAPMVLPAGAYFVLLDAGPQQLTLASALRGQNRHYRIGPASKAYDHASYVHQVHAFAGNGLRPYSPVHLRAVWSGPDLNLTWIRRSRRDADAWDLADIPLAEDSEAYVIRVRDSGGTLLRTLDVGTSGWTYTAAMQVEDGFSGGGTCEVAQRSARFGPGPFAAVSVVP
ncbi:glycoside hydrolase/phage tail family protein [Marivita sp. S6314]|uniref:baseplate multidomain protein megatron n=1 Tax=Marivita sp. S6314 TaxID=2926406 RepID=UPI001FF20D97|nr:glycoside hydrolase/phage tail family protein [Marivita sp. S6314]MCK0148805.1 glycoside hydrolase/phage tail family protein [Marivita sp. S6314]